MSDANDLRARVYASCDRAVENGYAANFDNSGLSIYEIPARLLAQDAMDTDADLEGEDYLAVLTHCATWQQARRPS